MSKAPKTKRTWIVAAIFIATFMTSVETTIVTTALPTIISQLNGLALQSWIFAVYLLTTAISTPIYGKLADNIGRKPIFISGLIVFSLGSFLCGVAPNIIILILCRALQGIGAGAIMPITFTIIADLFDYQQRANMMALNNTAWGISALLGPLVGGVIVAKLNWHWVFFINVPLGILVLILVSVGLKEPTRTKQHLKLDYPGIGLLSLTLLSLLLLFQNLGNVKLQLGLIIGLMVITLISGFLFYIVEQRVQEPIMPLNLFKQPLFTIQILTALLLSGVQIGFQTYFPIWLQAIYHVSAAVAGLAITPSPVLWLVTSFFVGPLIKRWSPKRITLPIVCLQLVVYIPLLFAGASFKIIGFYLIAGVTGAGLGIVITMNTLVAQRVVAADHLGTASAMLTLGRTLGQTIMTGVFGLLFNLAINHALTRYSSIHFTMVNQFISQQHHLTLSQSELHVLQQIILAGMHWVFLGAVVLFLLIIWLNLVDKNKKVVE
ncbi:MFS transporter [Agrilactobacillus fermenti]|uniref:MFS transporter n=1 Tax=Agrilactobacillus fermenti TaxID=2586909 RepID=UPI003A5C430A